MYPKSFYKDTKIPKKGNLCFVLMPFREAFDEVFDVITETLEDPQINFDCQRADDFSGRHIIEDILLGIGSAGIVIADLTSKNPNVFYELGIAHTIKNKEQVIILTQSMDDVPFDLQMFRCLVYSQSAAGLKKLKRMLKTALESVANKSYRFTVKSSESYKFNERLFGIGKDRAAYNFEIPELWALGNQGAKFYLEVYKFSLGNPVEKVYSDSQGKKINEELTLPFTNWKLIIERVHDGIAYFCLFESGDEKS